MKKNKIKKLLNRAFNSKNPVKKEKAIEDLLEITASFYSDEEVKFTHSIESSNILCCNETGRVMAVFYNDYDLDLINKNIQGCKYYKDALLKVIDMREQGFHHAIDIIGATNECR